MTLSGATVSLFPEDPREQAKYFALVARSVKEGIVVQAADGTITWANPQSARILGLSLDQLLGRAAYDPRWRCVREDGSDFPNETQPAMLALRAGARQPDVVMGVHKTDGCLSWVLVSSNPLPDATGVVTSLVDVTERVNRERELAATHAREVAVLDGANVSIIGTDLAGLIHTYNAAAERMLGYRAEEVVGKLTPECFHDRSELELRAKALGVPPGFEAFVHVAKLRSAETREWTYVRKDGSTFPVSLTVTLIRDPDGTTVGFMGIAENISEKREVFAELEKLALVASRTHNVVIVTDAQARTEWVNDAFTRLTGYTLSEVRGKVVGRMVQGPNTSQDAVATMRRAIRAGEGFQVEVLNYAKDGRQYWLDVDSRPIYGADGGLVGFVGVETEITARKQMEEELRQSEARLRAIVEALPDTVFRVSPDGVFRDVHAPDPAQLLMPPEEFLGKRLADVLPMQLATQLSKALQVVAASGDALTIEYQLDLGEGMVDYEARIGPTSAAELVVIIRDVTERKLLDRLKDEFLSTVSHELRTPLTSIQGTLGLLNAGVLGVLEAEAQQLVFAATSNSERLSRMIDDLLDIERATKGGLQLACSREALTPIIDRAVREASAFAREFDVRYSVVPSSESAYAMVDSDRLLQVLHNLLSNAAKYGSPSETVTVDIERVGDEWRTSVRNKGTPIPVAFRRRIFERFAMGDGSDRRKRQGTGLGLAISRAIVERMGGRLSFDSNADQTVFSFTVPAA